MKKIFSVVTSLTLLATLAAPTFADVVDQPVSLCPSGAICEGATTDPAKIIGNVLNFIFVLAAVLAVAFLIWGGIKWITANGDKTKVQSARDTIIGAIIGLVVAFAAYFIVNVVLTLLFGQGLGALSVPTIFQ